MSKTTIYYFSATGNSLAIAKKLAEKIENCKLISIVEAINKNDYQAKTQSIGFVFPLYYTGLPKFVKEFINKMNLSQAEYIFGVTTPGATKFGAIYKLKKILNKRGYKLNSGFYIQMPDNFILMLKIPPKEKQEQMFTTAKQKISDIAEIINKKINRIEENIVFNFLSGIIEKIWHIGLYTRDKKFHTNNTCNGCGICQNICPVNNIEIKNERPVWNNKCENCLACIHACPNNAIHWKKSTLKKGQYRHPEIQLKELMIGE